MTGRQPVTESKLDVIKALKQTSTNVLYVILVQAFIEKINDSNNEIRVVSHFFLFNFLKNLWIAAKLIKFKTLH